jgi:hypothetical protein
VAINRAIFFFLELPPIARYWLGVSPSVGGTEVGVTVPQSDSGALADSSGNSRSVRSIRSGFEALPSVEEGVRGTLTVLAVSWIDSCGRQGFVLVGCGVDWGSFSVAFIGFLIAGEQAGSRLAVHRTTRASQRLTFRNIPRDV